MRIFCAVRHASGSEFYGGLWTENFFPALKQLGHEVIELRTDLFPSSQFMEVPADFTKEESEMRARITERILTEVKLAHHQRPIQLFLSYFYNSHFEPAAFDELRKWGIPTVNFYCNSIHQFPCVAAIAAKADFSWHTERDAKEMYAAVGANPVWVQMGADPGIYRAVPVTTRQKKACFIGQKHADRAKWIARLIEQQIPVSIFGSGWKEYDPRDRQNESERPDPYLGRTRGKSGTVTSYFVVARGIMRREGLTQGIRRIAKAAKERHESKLCRAIIAPFLEGRCDNMAETLSSYEVALNFSNVWTDGQPGANLIPHVRLRDFEAPMCRACYLTGETDEIREFYDIGSEIDTYVTPEELIDKTRFYLKSPYAAERLREAGYQRARRDHTWVNRFDQLFRMIQIPG